MNEPWYQVECFILSDGSAAPSLATVSAIHEPTRVLLIEDNPGDVELLRIGFDEGRRQVALDVAGDGRTGLARLVDAARGVTPPWQLIVVDLNLPFYGGFELLAFIKRHERLRNVPAVVLTSSDRPAERVRARELDADGYFLKPTSFDGYATLIGALGQYLVPGPAR